MKSKGIAAIPLLIILAGIAALGLAGYFAYQATKGTNKNTNKAVACTLEAKVCPDGTSVGRVASSCEFAPCPNANGNANLNTNSNTNANSNINAANPTAGWKTYSSEKFGMSFKYPPSYTIYEGSDNTPYQLSIGAKGSGITLWLDQVYGPRDEELTELTSTKQVVIGGKSATQKEYHYTGTGKPIRRMIQFSPQPKGWGATATVYVTPEAGGSYSLADQILSTFTFTK